MAEAPHEITLLDVDPGRFRVSRWQNVMLSIWSGQATLESALRIQQLTQRMATEYPHGHSTVLVLTETVPIPDASAVPIFKRLQDRKLTGIACFAVVFEGRGFWASTMRSFITTVRMMAPRAIDFNMFDSVEPVGAWLTPAHRAGTGISLEPAALTAALHTVRSLGVSS